MVITRGDNFTEILFCFERTVFMTLYLKLLNSVFGENLIEHHYRSNIETLPVVSSESPLPYGHTPDPYTQFLLHPHLISCLENKLILQTACCCVM